VISLFSTVRSALPRDLLGRVAGVKDSVSEMGLTSLSGRVGLVGRILPGGRARRFQGVDDLPLGKICLESLRGTGVTFAEPWYP
jgi:hypothetical protein